MYVTRESYDQLERGAGQVYGCNHMTSKKRAEATTPLYFWVTLKKSYVQLENVEGQHAFMDWASSEPFRLRFLYFLHFFPSL